jgi:hypothetical protein
MDYMHKWYAVNLLMNIVSSNNGYVKCYMVPMCKQSIMFIVEPSKFDRITVRRLNVSPKIGFLYHSIRNIYSSDNTLTYVNTILVLKHRT